MPTRLRENWNFLRGVLRAVKRGHPFPAESRAQPAPAPGGTQETKRQGGPFTRLRGEIDWFQRSEHTVSVPGLRQPLEILHVTDTHVRAQGPWLERLCALLAPEHPDLLLLTGDLVTRGWTPDAADRLLSSLPQAPLGRFAVMGNWEYWGGAEREPWAQRLAGFGVELLHNRWTPLGPLNLVGIDDLLSGDPEVDLALQGLPASEPAVVMTHSPALFRLLQRPPVRLVLAGHSHAGQVRIPGLGSPFVPLGTGPYVAGWYRERGVDLFVSRGLGWSVAPLRWYCPPELAVIRLVPG